MTKPGRSMNRGRARETGQTPEISVAYEEFFHLSISTIADDYVMSTRKLVVNGYAQEKRL